MPQPSQILFHSGYQPHERLCSGGGMYTLRGTRARGALKATSSASPPSTPRANRAWQYLQDRSTNRRGRGGSCGTPNHTGVLEQSPSLAPHAVSAGRRADSKAGQFFAEQHKQRCILPHALVETPCERWHKGYCQEGLPVGAADDQDTKGEQLANDEAHDNATEQEDPHQPSRLILTDVHLTQIVAPANIGKGKPGAWGVSHMHCRGAPSVSQCFSVAWAYGTECRVWKGMMHSAPLLIARCHCSMCPLLRTKQH